MFCLFFVCIGNKIANIQIANLIKIIAESEGIGRAIQIHLHEKTLPLDASEDVYYLTPQVLSRFRSEWTIKPGKKKKSFVDIEDLLVQMIPCLVRCILIQRVDKNATLSIIFGSFSLFFSFVSYLCLVTLCFAARVHLCFFDRNEFL